MFHFLCCVCVWPGMVLNQRQVSLVVSDEESYLGILFPLVFRECLFSVLFYFTVQDCSFVVLLFFVSVFTIRIKNQDEHLPRCSLVLSFIRRPLQLGQSVVSGEFLLSYLVSCVNLSMLPLILSLFLSLSHSLSLLLEDLSPRTMHQDYLA